VNILAADMEERLATQVVVGHSSRSQIEIKRRGNTLRTLLRAIRSLDVIMIAVDPTR
jgi:two-component system sensor histidine kinase KdpD